MRSFIPATGREWLGLALALGALAMLGFRLWRLGDAPFINDEPEFLSAAREQLRTGHWFSASPVYGSQGVHYGPSPVWFYCAVQWLLGSAAVTCIAAMCVALCLAHVALAAGLARAFHGGWLQFATVLAFVASSPYQFIWSRLAWDQVVNACAGGVVFLLCARGELKLWTLLLLGLLLGYAISSHPMALPLVACTGAVIAIELRRSPKHLALASIAMGFGVVLINVPYLRFLARDPSQLTRAGSFNTAVLGAQLLQPARVSTFVGIEYFLDNDWAELKRWLGEWLLPDWGRVAVLAAVALASAAGLALATRSNVLESRRIALLAGFCWLAYPVAYASRNLYLHPHYQFPVYWVTAAGIASLVTWVRARKPLYGNLVCAAVLLFAFVQFGFVTVLAQFLHERNGTQGVHYSTPVARQEDFLRAACAQPAPTLIFRNTTQLFPASLKYLASTVRGCEGKAIEVCPPECPEPGPGVQTLMLRYANPQGGAITF